MAGWSLLPVSVIDPITAAQWNELVAAINEREGVFGDTAVDTISTVDNIGEDLILACRSRIESIIINFYSLEVTTPDGHPIATFTRLTKAGVLTAAIGQADWTDPKSGVGPYHMYEYPVRTSHVNEMVDVLNYLDESFWMQPDTGDVRYPFALSYYYQDADDDHRVDTYDIVDGWQAAKDAFLGSWTIGGTTYDLEDPDAGTYPSFICGRALSTRRSPDSEYMIDGRDNAAGWANTTRFKVYFGGSATVVGVGINFDHMYLAGAYANTPSNYTWLPLTVKMAGQIIGGAWNDATSWTVTWGHPDSDLDNGYEGRYWVAGTLPGASAGAQLNVSIYTDLNPASDMGLPAPPSPGYWIGANEMVAWGNYSEQNTQCWARLRWNYRT